MTSKTVSLRNLHRNLNLMAHLPAGTRAEHRRTYPAGMPREVATRLHKRAVRCAVREQVQRGRRARATVRT